MLTSRTLPTLTLAAGQRPDQVADTGDFHHLFNFFGFFAFILHRLVQPQEMRPVGCRVFTAAQLQPADGAGRSPHQVAAEYRRL